MAVYEIEVIDYVFLTESNRKNISAFSVTDFLALSEKARTQQYVLRVVNTLNIGDSVRLDKSIQHLDVIDSLVLSDSAFRAKFLSILDALMMYDRGRIVLQDFVTDILTLSETLVGSNRKPGRDTIAFTDSVFLNIIRAKTASDTFNLRDSVAVSKNNKYWSSIDLPTLSGPNAPTC